MLQRHPERARQTILRPLLGELRTMEPRVTAEGRFYALSAALSFGALVTGLIGTGERAGPPRGHHRHCTPVDYTYALHGLIRAA